MKGQKTLRHLYTEELWQDALDNLPVKYLGNCVQEYTGELVLKAKGGHGKY